MIKISEIIIVEGKYDKIKLSSIIDGIIIQTNGFEIFKNKEKIKMIKTLAEKQGILIITDSDVAGFKIRNFIKSIIGNRYIKNAYIPDVFGKEKRKSTVSKEGKLGVEGIDVKVLLKALEDANVTINDRENVNKITKTNLYELKITGHKNSRILRGKILKQLRLPEHLSSNMLLDFLNITTTFSDLKQMVCKINNSL